MKTKYRFFIAYFLAFSPLLALQLILALHSKGDIANLPNYLLIILSLFALIIPLIIKYNLFSYIAWSNFIYHLWIILYIILSINIIIEGYFRIYEYYHYNKWETFNQKRLEENREKVLRAFSEYEKISYDYLNPLLNNPDLSIELATPIKGQRPYLFKLLLKAGEISFLETRGGIEIFDKYKNVLAWNGWVTSTSISLLDSVLQTGKIQTKVVTGEVYSVVKTAAPIIYKETDEIVGVLVLEIPIEVNYQIASRFLHSSSFANRMTESTGTLIITYFEGDRDFTEKHYELFKELKANDEPMIIRQGKGGRATAYALLKLQDEPVGLLTIMGKVSNEALEELYIIKSKIILSLILLGYFILVSLIIYKLNKSSNYSPISIVSISLVLIWLGRSLLINFDFPDKIYDFALFGPSYYASTKLFGLLKSPGDLFLTSIILIFSLFFLIKQYPHFSYKKITSHPLCIIILILLSLIATWLIEIYFILIDSILNGSSFNFFEQINLFISLPYLLLGISVIIASSCIFGIVLMFFLWSIKIINVFIDNVNKRIIIVLATFLLIGTILRIIHFTSFTLSYILFLLFLTIVSFYWLNIKPKRITHIQVILSLLIITTLLYSRVQSGFQRILKERIEILVNELIQSQDSWAKFILEDTLDHFAKEISIAEALASDNPPENLAFIQWAQTSLSRLGLSCSIQIINAKGESVSSFAMEMPEIIKVNPKILVMQLENATEWVTYSLNRQEQGHRLNQFLGAVPIYYEDKFYGIVMVNIPYMYEELNNLINMYGRTPEVFRYTDEATLSTADLEDFSLAHYELGLLVESTIPEANIGELLSESIVDTLNKNNISIWEKMKFGNNEYELYFVSWGISYNTIIAIGFPTLDFYSGLNNWWQLLTLHILIGGLGYLIYFIFSRISRLHKLYFYDKLLIAFLLVSFLPISVLGIGGRKIAIQRILEGIEKQVQKNLIRLPNFLSESIKEKANLLAKTPKFINILKNPKRKLPNTIELIKELQLDENEIAILYDLSKNRIWTNSHSEDLLELDSSLLNITDLSVFYEIIGELSICAVIPILDPDNQEKLGNLVLVRHFDRKLCNSASENLDIDLSIFQGNKLLSSNRNELYQSELLSNRLEANAYLNIAFWRRNIFLQQETIGEYPYIVGYTGLKDVDGKVLGTIAIPFIFRQSEINEDIKQTITILLGVWIASFMLILAIAPTLAQTFSNPLSELTEATDRLTAGELGLTLKSNRYDEIGKLIVSFNLMSEALKTAHGRLERRAHYIKTIVDNIGSGVIAVDNLGKISALNQAIETMLKISEKEAIGKELIGLLNELGHKALAESLARICYNQEISYEELTITKASENITLNLLGVPLQVEEKENWGMVLVISDITGLVQSKKLLAWGEMARQVAHEIKNPLTPIKLSIQHLNRVYLDRPDEFAETLEETTITVLEQIERLRRTSIEFSVYAGLPKRNLEKLNLNTIVEKCASLYAHLDLRGIDLQIILDNKLNSIEANKDELERVLFNLIENAIYAVKDTIEKKIIISTNICKKTSNQIELIVEDTGCGISEENLSNLFEPSFSTKSEGTGLGLAICKQIVMNHNGEITVESILGKGSIFRLCFPILKE